MSLLDRGPDVLAVYIEVAGVDSDNNPVRVPSATPVKVRGLMQRVLAEESAAAGVELTTTYRFISRTFPGGAFARVEARGRTWDIIGEPQITNGSRRTRHVTVLLTARGPAAL